ncbi:DUF1127 domain-containing protein [Citreicella sp. C3M06]|uniref:DUF1127 domain-containing protein n=1 Tax=Roseobacteraceae TaxID=2854170 RepID=UPI001C089F1F|nr:MULTISPECIES: DUF1127 domain-containing protein [Roseobacteraceae]MBU2962514.1 DUF1127 domain-containing protein [Citreicella sp. C3M06]MDO6585434.1 DUF1127 domain-containing protein [Salipiger sp. 1_MG-2023]
MAFLTASHAQHTAPFLSRFFAALGNAIVAIGEANPRLRRVEALQRLSDEQLAAKGLRREDIVRHVFRDVYYL